MLAAVILLLFLAVSPESTAQPNPPATYYGQVQASAAFTPIVGMAVTAWVSDTLCGQAQTQDVGGDVGYTIDVQPDWADAPGCGRPGREVRFKVDGCPMRPLALWDNGQLHELDLSLDVPVAQDDAYTTTEGIALTVVAPGVLTNDDDVDGPALTAVKESDPVGTLALEADGAFTYTPTLNFNGVTSFTYHANNGITDANTAIVIITVMAVNDPPRFTSMPVTAAVEAVAYTYAITATDVDAGDGLTLTAPVKPAWLTLTDRGDGTGVLHGTPGPADRGQHAMVLRVRDRAALTDTQAFSITVAGETVPPTVIGVSPSDGATNVVRNAPIVINFSEAMQTDSVSVATMPTTTGVMEAWGNGDTRLSLNHAAFAASTRYTVTVTGSDLAGNPMADPFTWSFTTGTEVAPEADLALGKARVGSGVVTAGDTITYTFTITNHGPTGPVTATVVDAFSDVAAIADVSAPGCVWPGAETVTCTVMGVVTGTPMVLTLAVTTRETYSGTLRNSASVMLVGNMLDPNASNDSAGPVSVSVTRDLGDVTPPTVISVSPVAGATDVVRNAPIIIDFSEAMQTDSVSVATTPKLTGVMETWGLFDTRLTLNHDAFAAGTRYTVTVTGSDLAGNPMALPYTWAFTIGAEIAPEADLALGKARAGSGGVIAGGTITYTFTITNAGPTAPITATVVDVLSDPGALASVSGPGCVWPGAETITCTVTGVATGVPLVLTLVVTTRETYSGTLQNSATVAPTGSAVDPNASNDSAGPVSVSVTRDLGDVTPPTVTGVSPGDGATNVVRNAPIVIDFSEAMQTSSVSVQMVPNVTGVIETWGLFDTRLTLTHAAFAAGTRYTVTVTGSDLAGNPMASPYTWSFTTGADVAPEADLSLGKARAGSDGVIAGGTITYTFTITNAGPTAPITATVVDVLSDPGALASVSGLGCVWPGAETVTCTVTGVATGVPLVLTLVVTTRETYSGTLRNSATVAPTGDVVDPHARDNNAGPVVVIVKTEKEVGDNVIYLPLVLRNF
jgi:uncharacterized repeat protein (TIGR01451 family)